MSEADFGKRDDKGTTGRPSGWATRPVWPVQPLRALRWVFALPGYFLPWNLFYVAVGLLAWFMLSLPLGYIALIR